MQKSVRMIAVSRFLGLLFSIVSIFYSYSDFGNSVLSDSLIVCNSESGRRFSKFGILVIDWERLKVISILLEQVCRSSCWVRRSVDRRDIVCCGICELNNWLEELGGSMQRRVSIVFLPWFLYLLFAIGFVFYCYSDWRSFSGS